MKSTPLANMKLVRWCEMCWRHRNSLAIGNVANFRLLVPEEKVRFVVAEFCHVKEILTYVVRIIHSWKMALKSNKCAQLSSPLWSFASVEFYVNSTIELICIELVEIREIRGICSYCRIIKWYKKTLTEKNSNGTCRQSKHVACHLWRVIYRQDIKDRWKLSVSWHCETQTTPPHQRKKEKRKSWYIAHFVWVCFPSFNNVVVEMIRKPSSRRAREKNIITFFKNRRTLSHRTKKKSDISSLLFRRVVVSLRKTIHMLIAESVSFPFQSTYLSILTHNYVHNQWKKKD